MTYGNWSVLSVFQCSLLSSVILSCSNFNASTWMSVRGNPSTKTPTVGSQSNIACNMSSITYLSDIICPWLMSSLHSGVWSNWDTEIGGLVIPRALNIEGVWVPFPDLYRLNDNCLKQVVSYLPWCTHQKDKFSRQLNIFSSIMIFNIFPRLIKY